VVHAGVSTMEWLPRHSGPVGELTTLDPRRLVPGCRSPVAAASSASNPYVLLMHGVWLWRVAAAGFVLAALYHAAAVVHPALAPGSPGWRHSLFVGIDLLVAVGFFWRTRVFAAAFAVLTAQQLWSHGSSALRLWRNEHRVHWISVFVVVVAPLLLLALLLDLRQRRGVTGNR